MAGSTSAVADVVASAANTSRDRAWRSVLANLDRLGITAFIVNADGTVHQQNDSARNLLAGDHSVHVMENSQLQFSGRALNGMSRAPCAGRNEPSRRSSRFPVRRGERGL